jgi:CBS domain-containing protein
MVHARALCVQQDLHSTPTACVPNRITTDHDRTLLIKKIHRLPVVDEEGQLVGVLSRSNLVKAALALRSQTAAN